MSEAATVFAIYRFRAEVDEPTIADLLNRHRTALETSGLVTNTLPIVVRSLDQTAGHRDFIEIFEWKNEAAPTAAHSDPGIRQIWDEFERLTSVPAVSLGQLAEASRPFAHFAPFAVKYASSAPAKAAKTSQPKADAKASNPKADAKASNPKAAPTKKAKGKAKRAPAPVKRAAPAARRAAAKPAKAAKKPMPKRKALRKAGARR